MSHKSLEETEAWWGGPPAALGRRQMLSPAICLRPTHTVVPSGRHYKCDVLRGTAARVSDLGPRDRTLILTAV
jgi:hypothetical protein